MLEPASQVADPVTYCLPCPKNSERDSVKSAIVTQCLLNELIDPCQSNCNLPEMSLDPQTKHAVNRVNSLECVYRLFPGFRSSAWIHSSSARAGHTYPNTLVRGVKYICTGCFAPRLHGWLGNGNLRVYIEVVLASYQLYNASVQIWRITLLCEKRLCAHCCASLCTGTAETHDSTLRSTYDEVFRRDGMVIPV